MASRSSMLHVRVDENTKERASNALDAIGLSMSEAVRLFLRRVANDRAFPLELKAPNPETADAMREADQIVRARGARFSSADQLFTELEKTAGR